jgi:Tfp pilus assembly protein PilF
MVPGRVFFWAMTRHTLFSILLLGAALPVLAQKGTAPASSISKPAPTPSRPIYDPLQDPTRNGMATSGPTPAVTIPKAAGETVSMTTLAAPPDARAAYDKGVRAYNKQKWTEAQKSLEKAVEIYPKFAAAWYSLGVCLSVRNNPGDAAAAYRRSIEADPKYPDPYVQLAAVELNSSKWEEAAGVSGRVIHLDPQHFPEAYLYNSVANLQLLKFDVAERSAREALRTDTEHKYPKAEQMLGLALANEKDYAGARSHLTAYLELEKNPSELALARKQLAVVEQEASEAGRR